LRPSNYINNLEGVKVLLQYGAEKTLPSLQGCLPTDAMHYWSGSSDQTEDEKAKKALEDQKHAYVVQLIAEFNTHIRPDGKEVTSAAPQSTSDSNGTKLTRVLFLI
jgi:hypothetical protein